MLNNKQIAGKFDLLAKLMELHDENPFKIRSYANAYLSLRKLEGNLAEMPKDELASISGVGIAIADKIKELVATGEMEALKNINRSHHPVFRRCCQSEVLDQKSEADMERNGH